MRKQEIVLHGHRIAYIEEGEGPVIVLVHGITGTYETWRQAIPRLAREYTVLAPDLIGHGESAKPRGDYSLGAYASGIRDLLLALGHERATFVGHSLGGGVAMQLAYQFPERCERLVLVSSGGLGREVHLALRAASLPGSEIVLPLITSQTLLGWGGAVGRLLGKLKLHPSPDVAEFARGYASLGDAETRAAFLHTLRAVIDPGGQRVSARDRLYLSSEVPSLVIWGERDPIIPRHHGIEAHHEMPGSRFELIEGAGHFPHLDSPDRFVEILTDFMETTEPAWYSAERVRARVLEHGGGPVRTAEPVAAG